MPEGCPTLTNPALTKDVVSYLEPERAQIMRVADAAPFTAERTKRNRVEELIFYAHERGLRRLGVAFCR